MTRIILSKPISVAAILAMSSASAVFAASCSSAEDDSSGDLVGELVVADGSTWPSEVWRIVVEAQSDGGDAVRFEHTPTGGTEKIRFHLQDVPTGAGTKVVVYLSDPDARPGTLGSRTVLGEWGDVDVVEGENVLSSKTLEMGSAFVVAFDALQDDLFEPACNSCHYGGSGLALELAAGRSHGALVSVTADGDPSMARVTPGDADQSYLVKVFMDGGTHHGRIGKGQLELLIQWIEDGALP